jgi:hypothetical protein
MRVSLGWLRVVRYTLFWQHFYLPTPKNNNLALQSSLVLSLITQPISEGRYAAPLPRASRLNSWLWLVQPLPSYQASSQLFGLWLLYWRHYILVIGYYTPQY